MRCAGSLGLDIIITLAPPKLIMPPSGLKLKLPIQFNRSLASSCINQSVKNTRKLADTLTRNILSVAAEWHRRQFYERPAKRPRRGQSAGRPACLLARSLAGQPKESRTQAQNFIRFSGGKLKTCKCDHLRTDGRTSGDTRPSGKAFAGLTRRAGKASTRVVRLSAKRFE